MYDRIILTWAERHRSFFAIFFWKRVQNRHRDCLTRLFYKVNFPIWGDPVWWDLKLQESHNLLVGSPGIMWCWVWSCCVLRWMRAPPPPTLWWVERERERGEQLKLPTVSHHLLSGNASDGLVVRNQLAIPFLRRKNDIYVAIVQTSSASLECALSYFYQGEALEKLGPKGSASECISWQGSVIEDWKWHTGDPHGMRLFVSQLYPKIIQHKLPLTSYIFTGKKSVVSSCKSAGRRVDTVSCIFMRKVWNAANGFWGRWSYFDISTVTEVWGWDTCLWDHRRTYQLRTDWLAREERS